LKKRGLVTAPQANDAAAGPDGPERRCIITGAHGGPDELLRLALGPDGIVVPDVAGRLPGRGAWISLDKAQLSQAIAKGKIKGGLARSFGGAAKALMDGFVDVVEAQLRQRLMDRLGLERRAGFLVTGFDSVQEALRKGKAALLLHANDAAADGKSKLDGLARALELEPVSLTPLSRDELGLALGRDNVVHALLTDPGAAARVVREAHRFILFLGDPRHVKDV
jgi:uncharacterized protein